MGKATVVSYGCGDASGSGFGSSSLRAGKLKFRHGVWATFVQQESSNYRELRNVVNAIVQAGKDGDLDDTELFFMTDNSVTEACAKNGTSTSKALFDMVLELKLLETQLGVKVHIIHISGKRMIQQGTDGLSRGDLTEGVMAGGDMLSFLPLSQGAMEIQPNLLEWIQRWTGSPKMKVLTEMEWFYHGHKSECSIWAPAPAAASIALDEIAEARLKRPHSSGAIFIVRCVMKSEWGKKFGKEMDLHFEIPAGDAFWNSTNFEPLSIGILFPLFRHLPWRARKSGLVLDAESTLRGVQKVLDYDRGSVLPELWDATRRIRGMQREMVRKLLRPVGSRHLSSSKGQGLGWGGCGGRG